MSLTKNVIFSSILTVSGYIFPFIIFPYISRVLGPDNLGKCDYVDSIINYFMLISTLGISCIGMREIVINRHDQEKLNRTFTSLFVVTSISTIIAVVLLVFVIFSINEFKEYRTLLLFGILKLMGNFFLIEWLYKGLEDFKYITVRTLIIKCIYLGAVFVLIHNSTDYNKYYFLLCAVVAVNAIVNCWNASHLVNFDFVELELKPFVKPLLIFGLYLALNTMYTTFNVTYLGIKGGDIQVGYFSAANKFFGIMIGLYTAFTSVLMPRLTDLNDRQANKEFNQLINLSYDILMTFSIPVLIFGLIFAQPIIYIFAGYQFASSALPMQIMMPLIFIIGYEQIIVLQVLAPKKKDEAILINSCIGATIGVVLNILLVPKLLVVGTAFTWLMSEIAVLLSAQFFVNRYFGFKFPIKMLLRYCSIYIPVAVILLCVKNINTESAIAQLVVGGVVMMVLFLFAQLYILKSEAMIALKKKIYTVNSNRHTTNKK